MTIKENIELPLSISKMDKKESHHLVIEYAKKLGIEDILYKYPQECSGGQKQRVAIVRELVNDPEIIIADEPTGNLDSVNTKEVLKILKMLNDEGKTVIMVTHDSLVASYSTSMVYIKDGGILKK